MSGSRPFDQRNFVSICARPRDIETCELGVSRRRLGTIMVTYTNTEKHHRKCDKKEWKVQPAEASEHREENQFYWKCNEQQSDHD
jgi:hypothetical protein